MSLPASESFVPVKAYFDLFNSLRHSAGPLAFGLQAQNRGCVKLVGVKGWFEDEDEDEDEDADG